MTNADTAQPRLMRALDRAMRYADDDRTFGRAFVLLFAFSTVWIFFRSFYAFAIPSLPFEDGKFLLAFYTNNPEFSNVFRFYAGYVSFLPNLVGYLATKVDPLLTPYVMAVFSILVSSLAMTLFASRQFAYLIPRHSHRMIVCLAFILFPLGNAPIFAATMWTFWHLFWILLLLSVAPLPKSNVMKALQILLMIAAICSHPYAVFCIPIFAIRVFVVRDPLDRVVSVLMIAVIIAYALLGIGSSQDQRPVDIEGIPVAIYYIIHRVVFETVFGNLVRFGFHHLNLDIVVTVVGSLLLATLLFFAYKTRSRLTRVEATAIVASAALICVLTAAAVVARGMDYDSHLTQYGHRYFYTQQRLFILAVFVWLFRLIPALQWSAWSRRAQYATVAALCIYFIGLNATNLRYFWPSKDEGLRMRAYLVELRELKALPDDAEPRELLLPRDRGWEVRIVLPRESQ